MPVSRSISLAGAALLMCVLLASCGDDAPKRSATAGTTAAKGAPATIQIAAPADGKRVRARATKRGAWLTGVKVSGTAAAGATVFFRAGCRPKPCTQRTRADRDGSFSVTLKLRTQSSARFVTIDAGPDEMLAGGGSDVITVELYGPPVARASAGPSAPSQNRAGRPATRALPHELLLIGDSLAVGFGPALKKQLRGWRVSIDARVGRPLREGLRVLRRQGSKAPAILAFSLLTNNSPRQAGELATAVRATATRSGGCAVWATIVRPAYDGMTYVATNRMLARLADGQLALGLRIVDWAGAVAADRSLLADDHVHATPAGYAMLARMYADAIRACAGASQEP